MRYDSAMITDDLAAMVAGGETLAVQFKSARRGRLPDRELVETVACMANRDDDGEGWVLLGVEDDGQVTGTRAGEMDVFQVQALVSNRTRPAVAVHAETFELDGKKVLAIGVPRSLSPVGTADGRYLRRALGGAGKPACVPFHFREMNSRQADFGTFDYSAVELPELGFDALDPLEFARYRRAIRENRGGDEALLGLSELDMAKALGAVRTWNGEVAVRVLGLLLFGRQDVLAERLPTHEVAFQVLTDATVEANDFFRWPLLRVLEELETRARARRSERELLVGMVRVGVANYSARGFREGVANALIHRDYARRGAVHVQWRADDIVISNPGGLPEGVHVGNLLVTPPRPRNPLLADALKRAGVVERTARGVDTVFTDQIRGGRRAPRYEADRQTGVTLTLSRAEADLDFVRLVVEEERRHEVLPLPQLLLLARLWRAGSVDVAEAATLTQRSERDAADALDSLVRRGLCGREGTGEHRWRSSATREGESA